MQGGETRGPRIRCWSPASRGGHPHKGVPWCVVPEPVQGVKAKDGQNGILVERQPPCNRILEQTWGEGT